MQPLLKYIGQIGSEVFFVVFDYNNVKLIIKTRDSQGGGKALRLHDNFLYNIKVDLHELLCSRFSLSLV